MRISSISLFHLPITFSGTAYKMADGRTHESVDSTVVQIKTDDGLVGWGEICPWGTTYLPEFRDGARAAISVLAPRLIGRDPTNVGAVNSIMDRELPGHYYAKSALDLACWDLLGKLCGQPVSALLGGALAESVPLASAVFNGSAEEMIARIEARRNDGYRCFSTKPSGNPEVDLAVYRDVSAQRRDGETYIADANRAWSLMAARRLAPALDDLGFLIEQPCATYAECLKVRRASNAIIVLDELVLDNDMLFSIARDDAADVVQLKISRIGGLTAAKRMLDFCVISGFSIIWATSGGCEISDSAVTQIAKATPPERLIGIWSCREFTAEPLMDGGPEHREGRAFSSSRAGLGVEPDESRLGRPLAVFGTA